MMNSMQFILRDSKPIQQIKTDLSSPSFLCLRSFLLRCSSQLPCPRPLKKHSIEGERRREREGERERATQREREKSDAGSTHKVLERQREEE
jgi:hypothetical protein